MRLILFGVKGDTLVADTDIIEQLEKVIREYQQKGCAVLTEDGAEVVLKEPLPREAYILWPMAGGRVSGRLNDR